MAFHRLLSSATPSPSPTGGIQPPDFSSTWPDWAQWLIGLPLQIVLILVVSIILIAISRITIRRTTGRIARGASKLSLRPSRDDAAAAARRAGRARTIGSVSNSLLTGIIGILAVIMILQTLGIQVGVLLASIGVASLGVGLGAQTLIKDFLAGLFMLVEDQYGVGDIIDTGSATGKVIHVSLRVTTLRDEDGVIWYVPNGSIARIGNRSQGR